VGHLRENGFKVDLVEVNNIVAHQESKGVPANVRSCHSAQVGQYMVEGHVPADLMKRLLEEDGEQTGISVPGMVAGPPGMEGSTPTAYDVVTFDKQGRTTVYESR
jgi:hypothetical protein